MKNTQKQTHKGRRFLALGLAAALGVFLIGCWLDIEITGDGRVWSDSGTIDYSSNPEQNDNSEEYAVAGEEILHTDPDPGSKHTGWLEGGDHCGAGLCVMFWDNEDAADNPDGTEKHYTAEAEFQRIYPEPQAATYTYNALGQRVAKTVNGTTTFFVYDQYGRLISEVDASGNTLRSYAYLHGKLAMHFESAGTAEDGDYEVLTDHLGTPLMTVADPATSPNAEGGQEMVLSPFGEVTAMIGGGNNFRFPGQYYDNESGLHYNYYRDYDPGLGRYIQADPIGTRGGIPVYGYAGNNPANVVDFFGLEPSCREKLRGCQAQCRKAGASGMSNCQIRKCYDAMVICQDKPEEEERPKKPDSFMIDGCWYDWYWDDRYKIYRLKKRDPDCCEK